MDKIKKYQAIISDTLKRYAAMPVEGSSEPELEEQLILDTERNIFRYWQLVGNAANGSIILFSIWI